MYIALMDFFFALYDELKEWQAALGAVLGFLALIFAAQRHFSLNRRRDEELKNEGALSVMGRSTEKSWFCATKLPGSHEAWREPVLIGT